MRFLLYLLLPAATLVAQPEADYTRSIHGHRLAYKLEFLSDSRSPLKAADTALLAFFPPDPAWRFRARLEINASVAPFDMPTYAGKTSPYQHFGTLFFEKNGQTYSLRAYQNLRMMQDPNHADYLFVPFKDATNGESTYGGGRYLDLRMGQLEVEGSQVYLVLDFNKAYNPWCAYSDGYNCPIPPVENHLELAVDAGERAFKGEKKH